MQGDTPGHLRLKTRFTPTQPQRKQQQAGRLFPNEDENRVPSRSTTRGGAGFSREGFPGVSSTPYLLDAGVIGEFRCKPSANEK